MQEVSLQGKALGRTPLRSEAVGLGGQQEMVLRCERGVNIEKTRLLRLLNGERIYYHGL